MPERIYEEIGRRIREIRKSRGLTLEVLAARAGLTASYIGQVERMERKLSLLSVEKISNALGVSPSVFCSQEGKESGKHRKIGWAQRVVAILENLPAKQRALVWDTMMFVIRRQRRQRH